jgi:hypothetical protein
MSKDGRPRTIRVPLRKIGSALPALALITGGILFSTSAAPIPDLQASAASSDSPAIVVPDVAMTLPTTPVLDNSSPLAGRIGADPAAPAPEPLAPILAEGTVAGGSSLVTLDSTGIPVRALEAYRTAASLVASADPACHLDWALVAAIGRVESNHARFGGNQLDSAGVAQPGIIGMALDGSNGTARITDTDNGVLDRDPTYDRAVGPMQFIPSTWRAAGADANGDGVKNPQDMADAATAAAIYLCSGPGDLRRPADLRSAILRYNASDSYVQMVSAIADAYRHGVSALPASDLPARPASSTSGATRSVSVIGAPAGPGVTAGAAPAPSPQVPAEAVRTTAVPVTPAPSSAVPTTPAPSTSVPTTTAPSTSVPTTPVPTTPVPCTPVPTTTVPTTAVPTTMVPTTTTPAPSGPTPTVPATTAPCVPVPCVPVTAPVTPAPVNPAPVTPCPTPTVAALPATPGPTP